MTLNRLAPVLVLCVLVATVAHAQSGPGRGHGGRSKPSPSGSSPAPAAPAAPVPPNKPTNQIEIVGVVKAIDLATRRITIAYDAVDELNWPRGTMPFQVYKAGLLTGVAVGEKVRFKLDSQQISDLKPF